jgi:hypothetical protein
MIITGKENPITNDQSLNDNAVVEKIPFNRGIYKIRQWKRTDPIQATIKIGLAKIPIVKILESSLRALIALNISIVTRTDKDIVEALAFP